MGTHLMQRGKSRNRSLRECFGLYTQFGQGTLELSFRLLDQLFEANNSW